ncbi:MAG: hypothetical protein IKN88_09080 [Bacteroidales bacterium]|nr:hypothetical protein [Bacteroidales bacterium]
MPVDWKAVNEKRISEKSQEIQLYCSQKRQNMTPRAFELARLLLERLLDNIGDRTPNVNYALKAVRQSMSTQDIFVAECDGQQAEALARGVVYNYIGDDLNLYPITAEKKLSVSKARKQMVCDIPIEEMTTNDIIYVAAAIAKGENFSKQTMLAVYGWFKEIDLDPTEARIFSILFTQGKPISLSTLPQYNLFSSKYRSAAKALTEKGYICELPGDLLCVTETTIA